MLHKSCADFEEELKDREDRIVRLHDQLDQNTKVMRANIRIIEKQKGRLEQYRETLATVYREHKKSLKEERDHADRLAELLRSHGPDYDARREPKQCQFWAGDEADALAGHAKRRKTP